MHVYLHVSDASMCIFADGLYANRLGTTVQNGLLLLRRSDPPKHSSASTFHFFHVHADVDHINMELETKKKKKRLNAFICGCWLVTSYF